MLLDDTRQWHLPALFVQDNRARRWRYAGAKWASSQKSRDLAHVSFAPITKR
ncbi:hypothetical protein XA26_40120 [Mycolicibacterium fortuitum]|uniref:Uncharacterized protein n=1 Tax=Mycolicibacterium fortuitum TaxID=1766 RepID=A0A0N9XV60_MYCFO|nr:hypothetical protein XA26_40120 [Mycolicibacterium fortuitum]